MPFPLVPIIWATLGAGGAVAVSRRSGGANTPYDYGQSPGGLNSIVGGFSQRELMLAGAASVLAIAAYKVLR